MGLNWNTKGSKTVEDLVAALSGEIKAPVIPQVPHLPPPPVNKALAVVNTEVKCDPGALFS